MATVLELKTAVAGFMQRELDVFVRNGPPEVDLLLRACNNARLYAERRLDFELSKVQVDFAMTLGGQTAISAATLYGTATAVSIKKIVRPYLHMTAGGEYPVELWSKSKWAARLQRRYEKAGVTPLDTSQEIDITDLAPLVVVQDGPNIFVAPADTATLQSTFTVSADAIKWLDAYADNDDTDFLLTYAFDWMMYRCIFELNFFLKEDERVQLSNVLMKEAWDALVTWNNQLMAANVDDTDLN